MRVPFNEQDAGHPAPVRLRIKELRALFKGF
jgi:hypothetical protein